jgi:protein-S-isoprenylcysteine O-methyltransferase Ste14
VPHHPASALVTTGAFRFSRNPVYTGLAVGYVGVAPWAGTWWPLTVAALCVLATDPAVAPPPAGTPGSGTRSPGQRH